MAKKKNSTTRSDSRERLTRSTSRWSATAVTSADIGNRIRELLDANGMSVYRLSKLTGIDQTALANNIKGKHLPNIANIERICDALGITLSQFFTADFKRVEAKDEQ